MEGTPLQRHRRALGMTQEQVADQLRNEVGPAHGYPNLGIDANAVCRHERGIIAIPQAAVPGALRQAVPDHRWNTVAAG